MAIRDLGDYVADDPVIDRVSSLPGSPYDGQVISYVAAAGVLWQLMYNSGSGSAHKWEFIGGSPLVSEVDGTTVITSGSFSSPADVPGEGVTVPLAGDYWVDFGCYLQGAPFNAAGDVSMGFSIGAAAVVVADTLQFQWRTPSTDTECGASVSRRRKKTGLTAGVGILAKYSAAILNSPSASRRFLLATPIRVS